MLSLKIDGTWEPQDFVEVLRSIESFYYKLEGFGAHRSRAFPLYFDYDDPMWRGARFEGIPFEVSLDLINQRWLEFARYETPASARLWVRRIDYASPGGLDILGVGKAIQAIVDSIARMKVYYDDRHVRRERDKQAGLDTELKKLQLEKEKENIRSIQIQNARSALELIREHPGARESLVPLLVRDQEALAPRIADRKIISATFVQGDGTRN